jgi:hypothetical protein
MRKRLGSQVPTMWLGLLFPLILGARRKWSLDAKIATADANSNATG